MPAQRSHPFVEPVQFAGNGGGTDQRSDRRAADHVRRNAVSRQCLNHTDMRPSAGSTAAEREADAQVVAVFHVLACIRVSIRLRDDRADYTRLVLGDSARAGGRRDAENAWRRHARPAFNLQLHTGWILPVSSWAVSRPGATASNAKHERAATT